MAAERRDVAPFRHVVVAADFTPGAAAAFQRALTPPVAGRGLIELAHVLPRDLPRTTIRAEDAASSQHPIHSAAKEAKRKLHIQNWHMNHLLPSRPPP